MKPSPMGTATGPELRAATMWKELRNSNEERLAEDGMSFDRNRTAGENGGNFRIDHRLEPEKKRWKSTNWTS